MISMHMGRAWTGHIIEDACPCPKAPCGLAAPGLDPDAPECEQHNPSNPLFAKTMRQNHTSDRCPGHDHSARCCTEHGTHSNPHRGCILR